MVQNNNGSVTELNCPVIPLPPSSDFEDIPCVTGRNLIDVVCSDISQCYSSVTCLHDDKSENESSSSSISSLLIPVKCEWGQQLYNCRCLLQFDTVNVTEFLLFDYSQQNNWTDHNTKFGRPPSLPPRRNGSSWNDDNSSSNNGVFSHGSSSIGDNIQHPNQQFSGVSDLAAISISVVATLVLLAVLIVFLAKVFLSHRQDRGRYKPKSEEDRNRVSTVIEIR